MNQASRENPDSVADPRPGVTYMREEVCGNGVGGWRVLLTDESGIDLVTHC